MLFKKNVSRTILDNQIRNNAIKYIYTLQNEFIDLPLFRYFEKIIKRKGAQNDLKLKTVWVNRYTYYIFTRELSN